MFDFADNRRPCVSCFSVRWAFCFLTTSANVASPSDPMFVFISSRPPRRSCCRPCLVGGRSVCQQDQTKTTKQTSTKLGWRMGPINLWFGIVREGVFSIFWLISQGNFYGSWWKKLSWAPWGFRYLWVSTIWHRSKSFYQGWPVFSRNSHQFNFDFYQPIILPQHTGDQDSIYIVLLC